MNLQVVCKLKAWFADLNLNFKIKIITVRTKKINFYWNTSERIYKKFNRLAANIPIEKWKL